MIKYIHVLRKNPAILTITKKIFAIAFLLLIVSILSTTLIAKWKQPAMNKQNTPTAYAPATNDNKIIIGAERMNIILSSLKGKRVGMLINQTSQVGNTSLIDTLLDLGVNIKAIFCPEHGCHGKISAGQHVNNTTHEYKKITIPVFSLYGATKKPMPKHLENIDIVVFDIQDVGARFYTYISTLYHLMQVCAENDKTVMVLDRPNPNGEYVDGPILEPTFKSFVGMLPIPIVHGMTLGELARMINGEGWLNNRITAKIQIVPLLNYTHSTPYIPPIAPSPNLITHNAIKWYPSICLFEGTAISVARGTMFPFEAIGSPTLPPSLPFQFTPKPIAGMVKNPKHEYLTCYGFDLKNIQPKAEINLEYLIRLYQLSPQKKDFFTPFFNKLAGNNTLRKQLQQGLTKEQIKASWQPELDTFKKIRMRYLLYPN